MLLFSSVLAKKFVSDNITEQVMINGNHKRQYWNLNDTNESIGLNLTYLDSESAWQNKLPTMVQISYRKLIDSALSLWDKNHFWVTFWQNLANLQNDNCFTQNNNFLTQDHFE